MKRTIIIISLVLGVALGVVSTKALAGDASNIKWSCSEARGNLVTGISIENGLAYITQFMKNNHMMPRTIGGPYRNLVTFGGGDYYGVKSTDGTFSLIASSLTATLNDGSTLSLDNVTCKSFE